MKHKQTGVRHPRWIGLPGTLVLAVTALACGGDAPPEPSEAPAAPEPAATPAADLPATDAEAVWEYLQRTDYRANWDYWPERAALYAGQEPHGMLLTTYVNSIAAAALTSGAPSMPAGAIIVKENWMPDSTYAAATVMYKSPGFDPENNDWWWLKRLADGTVEASGQGAGCINCHRGVQANDYIWTSTLGGGE